MAEADFSQYLNVPMSDMKRVVLPKGHYFGRVKDYAAKESSTGKPMLNVSFSLDSAGEDVDTAALPDSGVGGKVVSVNYMLDQDFGRAGIREVIVAAGVAFDETQPFGQYLPAIKGQPVMLLVDNRRRDKDDPNSELMEDVKKVLAPT